MGLRLDSSNFRFESSFNCLLAFFLTGCVKFWQQPFNVRCFFAQVVDDKIAIDAEMSDSLKNERFEDCFVVEGIPRIPDDVVGKPWQDQAVRDVQAVLKLLMGREMNIVFISNATTRQADAIIAYSVKMATVAESKAIRDKFGSYFVGGRGDQRPPELKPYSIKNRVTPETKIRISVLKLLAQRYRDSNPGSRVAVIGYQPRPLIKITPPSNASDRRVKSFNYVEAVKTLPTNFSASELAPIIRRINPRLAGQIRSIFIILSDDQYKMRAPDQGSSSRGRGSSRGSFRGRGTARGGGRGNESSTTNTNSAEPTMSEQSGESSDPSETEEIEPEPEETIEKTNSGRSSKKRGASSDKGAPSKR